jgi:hypothetical protein
VRSPLQSAVPPLVCATLRRAFLRRNKIAQLLGTEREIFSLTHVTCYKVVVRSSALGISARTIAIWVHVLPGMQTTKGEKRGGSMLDKYDALYLYLKRRSESSFKLTFSGIERIICHPLPSDAEKRPDWWANETNQDTNDAQCRAWLQAGYKAFPDLALRTVMFRRP